MAREAALFDIRHAYVYNQLGLFEASSGEYSAGNPPFGAIVNYYLREPIAGASVIIVVRDGEGELVAEVEAQNQAGMQRGVWNLRGQPPPQEGNQPSRRPRLGPLVDPGTYFVSLEVRVGTETTQLAGREPVVVIPLPG
jgi:hypothetical protein